VWQPNSALQRPTFSPTWTFPVDHLRTISSTNAIERVNAELDRRAKVVGIFLRLYPPPPAVAEGSPMLRGSRGAEGDPESFCRALGL